MAELIYKRKPRGKIPDEIRDYLYKKYCNGDNSYKSLKELAEDINKNTGTEGVDIVYKKPCNLHQGKFNGKTYIYVAKNLNFLEKLIFEYHLQNFQKKNNSD